MIFDGDDTLWRVEELYDAALLEAQQSIETAGIPGEEWRLLQREHDLRNVKTLGMSPERFPLSSQQALLEIGRKHSWDVPPDLVEKVVAISQTVFARQAPVMPMARQVLTSLVPAFRLALLTKGDPLIQQGRVKDSGLIDCFERVQVVPDKNEKVFTEIVSDFDVRPEKAWSVGNSLASDVNPALRAGLNAIWIDAHVWEHERRETVVTHPRLVVLNSLQQVPPALLASVGER